MDAPEAIATGLRSGPRSRPAALRRGARLSSPAGFHLCLVEDFRRGNAVSPPRCCAGHEPGNLDDLNDLAEIAGDDYLRESCGMPRPASWTRAPGTTGITASDLPSMAKDRYRPCRSGEQREQIRAALGSSAP